MQGAGRGRRQEPRVSAQIRAFPYVPPHMGHGLMRGMEDLDSVGAVDSQSIRIDCQTNGFWCVSGGVNCSDAAGKEVNYEYLQGSLIRLSVKYVLTIYSLRFDCRVEGSFIIQDSTASDRAGLIVAHLCVCLSDGLQPVWRTTRPRRDGSGRATWGHHGSTTGLTTARFTRSAERHIESYLSARIVLFSSSTSISSSAGG